MRPAVVAGQVGGRERQPIGVLHPALLQHRAHVAFARQIAHGRTDLVPGGQELHDAVTADKARPAGRKAKHKRKPEETDIEDLG